MKQLNLLNSPSKGIHLKKAARLEIGIKKIGIKEKINKLQVIFKNESTTSGSLKTLLKIFRCFNEFSLHVDEIERMKRKTKTSTSIGCFHEAIGSILVMAQCFAIMPVIGVKSKSASNLKFQWKSVRVLYSFVAFLFALIYAVMTVGKTLSREIQFDRTSKFVTFPIILNKCIKTLQFICSKCSVLWFSRLWDILFRIFGKKMAKTNATLGIN